MTDSIQQAREAFGLRLREIRRNAGLTGRQLANLAGWHESRVSKIEYGKVRPSVADLRLYCTHADQLDQLPDLTATLNHVEASYLEWRRVLSAGTKRGQQASLRLAQQTEHMRAYQPVLIPGLLQIPAYAEVILGRSIKFHGIPDDLDEGVSKRMERQRILYKGSCRFHFIIGEQALCNNVGGNDVMLGQLDRLFVAMSLPSLLISVLPLSAELPMQATNFVIFDNRRVTVEAVSAELTITQPREIATYRRTFDVLASKSVTGDQARALIRKAIEMRSSP